MLPLLTRSADAIGNDAADDDFGGAQRGAPSSAASRGGAAGGAAGGGGVLPSETKEVRPREMPLVAF